MPPRNRSFFRFSGVNRADYGPDGFNVRGNELFLRNVGTSDRLNGALLLGNKTVFSRQRRNVRIRRKRRKILPVKLYPFKTLLVDGSEVYLGGDRPRFLVPEFLNFQTDGLISSGRGASNYTVLGAIFSNGTYEYRGVGEIEFTVNSPTGLSYFGGDLWGPGVNSTTRNEPDRNAGTANATLVGTPEGADILMFASNYPLVPNGWVRSYPESYVHVGSHTSISRTYTWDPGFLNIPAGGTVTQNLGTQIYNENMTAGVGGAPTSIGGCTSDQASGGGDLGFTTQVTVPGRTATNQVDYDLQWSEPLETEVITRDGRQTFPGTHTLTETLSQTQTKNCAERVMDVTAVCVLTGTFSDVPRVSFNIASNTATITGSGQENYSRVEEYRYQYPVARSTQIEDVTTYRTVSQTSIPQVSLATNLSSSNGATWLVAATRFDEMFEHRERSFVVERDDLFESSVYGKSITEESTVTNKNETRDTPTNVNFSNDRTPTGLGIGEFNGGFWINTIPTTGTTSLTGTQVTNAYQQQEYFYQDDDGQQISFGISFGELRGTVPNSLTAEVGDIITLGGRTLVTGIRRVETLDLDSRTTVRSYTPVPISSHVIGRRFIVQVQDSASATRNFTVYLCTGESFGNVTNVSDRTFHQVTTVDAINLRVDQKLTNIYSPPRSTAYAYYRFDNFEDISVYTSNATIKRSQTPGVLWNIYFVRQPVDREINQKWGYTTAQFLETGAIVYNGEEVVADYVGHGGNILRIKVTP